VRRDPEAAGRVSLTRVRAGLWAGLVTCIAYPLVTVAPLPRVAVVVLAAALGPALAIAAVGLREALRVHRETLLADLGALFDVLAGALLEAMVLVQLAVRLRATGEGIPRETVGVWLGLDVAWDVYVGLGTACFAVAMLRHPRFGKTMGVSGIVLAAALLGLNLGTFPTPPAEAGLVDVGPLVGLWYLAATILMWRSLPWLAETAGLTVASDRR
jgi:hypothetical protein